MVRTLLPQRPLRLLRPRHVKAAILAASCAALLPWTQALAQPAWPSKPIRLIIPFAPGAATDVVARMVSEEMREDLGQTFVIDNRAGANGFIAAEAAARAAPDGYTLMATSTTTHTTNQYLFKKLPYDPVKDFTPIGGMMRGYYLLVVPTGLGVNNVNEWINWLKANRDKASYGWGAAASQISGFSLLKDANLTAVGVPYKSSPQVVNDLIGGQLSFMVLDVATGLAHVRSGRVKALAVSSSQRLPNLPEVPANAEAGLPNFTTTAWVGLFAPAGTPEAIVTRLNGALQKALRKPGVAQRIDACCAARLFPTSPAEFDEFLRQQRVSWAQKIKDAGLQPE